MGRFEPLARGEGGRWSRRTANGSTGWFAGLPDLTGLLCLCLNNGHSLPEAGTRRCSALSLIGRSAEGKCHPPGLTLLKRGADDASE
jgi:hypothetical protein